MLTRIQPSTAKRYGSATNGRIQAITGALLNGAQGRNRTTDTVIFSHVLYQLSYLGPHFGLRAEPDFSRANGSPNGRPRCCPPYRGRPPDRAADSLRRAI